MEFFSLTNLIGGGISLAIGVAVYLLFVHTLLYNREKGYLNRWPKGLDLEEIFYRPVFVRFLPWLGTTIASFLDYIPNSKLVTVWIPRAVTSVFSFFDHFPDSKLVREWIPKGITAVFSFLDHLPESWFFMKFLPGVCVAVSRVFDLFMDTALLFIRSLFLTSRTDLQYAKDHNPITRLSCAITEALYQAGLVPGRLIRRSAPDDDRYGTYITNAISFGLLLTAAGIVAAIVYVFVRMGV